MSWAGTSALVTGGGGFIGSHLKDELLMAGARVTVLDVALSPMQDLRTYPWNDLHEFDVIFHFAASAYVPPSVKFPLLDYETNCSATLRLLDALRCQKWRGKLIYASSAAVYGNPLQLPVTERCLTVPVSPYGCGKLAAERYVNVYAQLYGIKAASLRFFSVYGPRQKKQVVFDLMTKIQHSLDAKTYTVEVHGDGTQVRDFLYVEDAVHAALAVARQADMVGEVYNVASGEETSIHELACQLCLRLGARPDVITYTGKNRPGDPERLVVDIGKLQALGYEPLVRFEDGLTETVEWFLGA